MNGSASARQFGDDERDALRHQPRNERDVARETIELGDANGAAETLRLRGGGGELRLAIERVDPFPD